MKKFYIPYIVFCTILITQFIFNISFEQKNIVNPTRYTTPNVIKKAKVFSDNIENDFFLVKAKDNKIYLYDKNNQVLDILDIEYSTLREYDKNQFINGIKVNNMQDVYSLIEDFSN